MIFLQSIFGCLVVCILEYRLVDGGDRAPVVAQHAHLDVPHAGDGRPRDAAVSCAVLLLCAAVCVPILLIGKPYFIWREMNHEDEALLGEEEANGNGDAVEDADDEASNTTSAKWWSTLSRVYLAHGFVPPALSALSGPRTVLWSMTILGLML
ncbi:hypothetical protein C8J57DRAFT_1714298 [Mycena rebaudengoi]|nr:hypothetical protein C8J57DRAFT_1714298 [Mycena rebaudengoi]